MKKAAIQSELIHLLRIHILSAEFRTSNTFRELPQRPAEVRFGFSRSLANNLEQGRTRIRLTLVLEGLDDQAKELGLHATYELEFHFKVDNFQDFVQAGQAEEQRIDARLGATLLGIAFSTARGLIYERTRGTFFDGAVLPVIDPYAFLLSEDDSKSV